MHDAGILYLLGHIPEQAVMTGDDDFGRPPARPDSQCTKFEGQPPGLSLGQLDVGVDARDERRDDLSPRG